MTPGTRLVAGCVLGIAGAATAVAAVNATWRIVTPASSASTVTIGGERVHVSDPAPVALKGSSQDASLAPFAILGGVAAAAAGLLGPKPRIGATGLLGILGVEVAVNALLAQGRPLIPSALLRGEGLSDVEIVTDVVWLAVAGGLAMFVAAVWLFVAAREAPPLRLPEGPPEPAGRDEGAWE